MEILRNPIVELPEGLSETALYDLIMRLDAAIRETYQIDFTVEDEFPAITEAVRMFYTYPELDDDGNPDKYASEIDLNYLSFQIQSYKSTRWFSNILDNGDFNLDLDADTFIQIDPSKPTDIILNFSISGSDDVNSSVGAIDRMINHLLYFHNLIMHIERYVQTMTLEAKNALSFQVRYINQAYYERNQ